MERTRRGEQRGDSERESGERRASQTDKQDQRDRETEGQRLEPSILRFAAEVQFSRQFYGLQLQSSCKPVKYLWIPEPEVSLHSIAIMLDVLRSTALFRKHSNGDRMSAQYTRGDAAHSPPGHGYHRVESVRRLRGCTARSSHHHWIVSGTTRYSGEHPT